MAPGDPEDMETVEDPVGGPLAPVSDLTLPGEWLGWATPSWDSGDMGCIPLYGDPLPYIDMALAYEPFM